MTSKEYQDLVDLYPSVVKSIYPNIDYIPMGDPGTVETLQANWPPLDKEHPKPTEAQLLQHLVLVKAIVEAEKFVLGETKDDLAAMEGWNVDLLLNNLEDRKRLLKAVLHILGALSGTEAVLHPDRWFPYE